MRTLNGIIQYMGILSSDLGGEEQEEQLAIKAIRDSNMPKFIADDYRIYEGILDDLFPKSAYKEKPNEKLVELAKEEAIKANLTSDLNLLKKIEDFHNILSVRHAVMLVGEAMTSKSTFTLN